LLERRDEGPGHGTSGLRLDGGVGSVQVSYSSTLCKHQSQLSVDAQLTKSDHPYYHST
jgi:hypothetical protein